MTKPLIQIGSDVREMTDAEHAQWLADAAEIEARHEATQAAIAAKESAQAKLAALGLTEEEVAALIGG